MKTEKLMHKDRSASDKRSEVSSYRIPRIEEQLTVHKRETTKGEVHLEKKVKEHTEDVTLSLLEEEVEVKRKPYNQYVEEAPPAVRTEGEYTIVSVVKEVLVKRLLLVEEVYIRKNVQHTEKRLQVPLRKEEIHITRK